MEDIERTKEQETIERDNKENKEVEDAGNFLINGPNEILDGRYLLIVKKPTALQIY